MILRKLRHKAAENEKKKLKKKTKKTLHRVLGCVLGSVGLFCTGYMFGLHHKLIVAKIKGEELPKTKKCLFHR